MRTFEWIFDKDGNVNEGLECIYDRQPNWNDFYDDPRPQVVSLGKYRPYYTDGTPDPSNEEVNEACWIECDKDFYADQYCLKDLFPIISSDKEEVLYNGEIHKVLHKYINRNDDAMYVLELKNFNGQYITVEDYELEERRDIDELNEDDMRKLFAQIIRGSINFCDYHNTLGVPCSEVMDYCDGYYEWLNAQFENRADDMDNINSFLQYAGF